LKLQLKPATTLGAPYKRARGYSDSVKRTKTQSGGGVIELGLLFSVLLLLLLGVIDFALVTQQSMVVSEAAYAGAQYGAFTGNSSNTTMMQTIATNSATGISGFAATATKWCACSAGGTSVSCASTCVSYGTPIAYVQVVTTATPSVLFRYTGIPLTVGLRGVCVLRVQ
jgi:Flp pilus assembly protein TadG